MSTTDQKLDELARQVASLAGIAASTHEVLTRTETRLCAFAQFAGATHIGSPPKNSLAAKPAEGERYERKD